MTVSVAAAAQAQEQTQPAPESQSASAPVAVAVTSVVPPKRRVIRHRFRPWGQPSPRQVRRIIKVEARRWKVDSGRLANRIRCESGFRWWAGNGPYVGLLQFHASTFHRGLGSIRDRRVRFVRERTRRARVKRTIHYSDGHTKPGRSRFIRQRVIHVYEGRLPRRPPVSHAWAQVRIGAQALRGISAVRSSEWGCPA